MTILSIAIALVALVGFISIWLRLKKVKEKVDYLEQRHASSEVRKAVNVKELSLSHSVFSNGGIKGTDQKLNSSVAERLIVLGYRSENIIMDNQTEGVKFSKKVTIEIPEGTTHVVPLIRGFFLVFGKATSNTDDTSFGFDISDHHLGVEHANVYVVEVGRVTATLEAQMLLRDENGDDRWTGGLGATILFLGPHP